LHRIEAVVGIAGEAVRPVVDVEQDRVIIRFSLGDHRPDVAGDERDAGIVETAGGELRHRSARPVDDLGDEFGDGEPGAAREGSEGGAQGEAHAITADQKMGRVPAGQALDRYRGERFLEPLIRLFISSLRPSTIMKSSPRRKRLSSSPPGTVALATSSRGFMASPPRAASRDRPSRAQRLRQRAFVEIVQLAADR
jgi:hypothetical protein